MESAVRPRLTAARVADTSRPRRARRRAKAGSSLRVAIGSRYPVFNAGLERMLEGGGVTVAAVAASPDELVRLARLRRPAVAIVDAHSGGDWVRRLPKLRSTRPGLAVIAVAGHDGAALHSEVLRLGCSSVLSLRATQREYLEAIHSAMRGYGLIETDVLQGVLTGREAQRRQTTVPEEDILRCLSHGLSNRQIASRLRYSVGTVKSYIHNIFEKLDVSDRTEAVVKALRIGIID